MHESGTDSPTVVRLSQTESRIENLATPVIFRVIDDLPASQATSPRFFVTIEYMCRYSIGWSTSVASEKTEYAHDSNKNRRQAA